MIRLTSISRAVMFLLMFSAVGAAHAQVTGIPRTAPTDLPEEPSGVPRDTLFLFQPARPLVDSVSITTQLHDVIGLDLLFSNSGFGAGLFYQHNYSQTIAAFANIGITGSRDRDEFEQYDDVAQDWRVPGKINRLYTFPLTVGLRFRLLEDVLVDNFRPYANIGVGPSMVVALPYAYGFFSSFRHARAYFTGGGFIGIGAEIGGSRPMLGVNIRYFYIPMHPGVESLIDDPITNFGGLFLTMNVGFM